MGAGVYRKLSLSPLLKQGGIAILLCLGFWQGGCTPLIQPPTPVASSVATEAVHLIVQVQYPTVDILNALAGELDVWEVDRTAQTFVARITLAQFEQLQQQDLPVELDCAKMAQYGQIDDAAPANIIDLVAEQCPRK